MGDNLSEETREKIAKLCLSASELLFLLSRFQNLERAQQALIHTHHGSGIVKLAAIVGCAKKRNQLSLGEELVTVFDNLMGAAYQIHVMLLQEPRDDIGAEGERYTTVILAPASDIFVGVGPEEIAEESAVGDISWAHDAANLLHGVEIRAQTTMHCEDLLVNDCCNGQAVEAVSEGLPELDVIPSLALVVEPVDPVDGSTFVIATQDEEVFGVLDLVGKQKADGLERLLSAVDIVSKEEVVCLRRETAIFE